MFSQMGFQSFFFSRIDYQDKQQRMSERALEMIWKPRQTTPDPANYIFTHVNYYHYSPPPGFCFDLLCNSAPIPPPPSPLSFVGVILLLSFFFLFFFGEGASMAPLLLSSVVVREGTKEVREGSEKEAKRGKEERIERK